METTAGSDIVGEDYFAHQDDTLTLRSKEKSNGDLAREKTMNCKQPRAEKQLGASASEIIDNTIGLEQAVSLVCRIKIRVCVTIAGVRNL